MNLISYLLSFPAPASGRVGGPERWVGGEYAYNNGGRRPTLPCEGSAAAA
ncbi:hypothetical protein JJE63_05875 [Alloprevotella tannerae]|nr:hypothetical protein [Alloprevotella tannerae]MCG2652851.1 hypothetical protein [Alloprevotella tannerae]